MTDDAYITVRDSANEEVRRVYVGRLHDGEHVRLVFDADPFARLAAAIHDAARLALAVQACNALIVHRVPRGEEGRRDLVTIGAYAEMAFARNAAERELALWRETCAVPLVVHSPPSPQRGEGRDEGASEEEFGAEILEAAER